MRLVKCETFAERYFDPECRPDPRTIRSWVKNGAVAGKIIQSTTYVDVDAFERTTGYALVDKIMDRIGPHEPT